MASAIAVAFKQPPAQVLERFSAERTADHWTAGGLPLACGQDFVVVNTLLEPRETIDAALARVDLALPLLRQSSEAVAIGLGGGAPSESTAFAEWTAHWIRGESLSNGGQPVARAMFSAVVRNPGSTADSDFLAQILRKP